MTTTSIHANTFTILPIVNLTSQFLTLAVITTAVIYILYGTYHKRKLVDKDGNGIPHGPVGLPIVGKYSAQFQFHLVFTYSLGSFPFLTHYPELTLDYWAKRYGPLYSVWLGNQLFVIVSDPNIVKDLMVTNGAIFSSRKEMFLKSQIIFAGRGITATPYNDRWFDNLLMYNKGLSLTTSQEETP